MLAQPMCMLAKMTFKSAMTPMPFKYKFPSDLGQYSQAFSPAEKIGMINPMWLFMAVSTNTYHTVAAATNTMLMETYIEGIFGAICSAIDKWKGMATLVNVKVMAVSAVGQPGCLKGPPLKPLILAEAPMKTQQEQKYSKAIATAVDAAWKKWQDKVTVPGLPWYPAFAAFPGPMAPPMPNIPVPLILLPSAMMSELTTPKLADAMKKELGDSDALHQKVLFNALATAISTMFLAWLPTCLVTNVLGQGPIPTFAPPFVPVGPVVNGMANQTPGGLTMGVGSVSKKGAGQDVEKIKKQMKEAEQKAKNSEQEAKNAKKKLDQDFANAQKEL